MFHRKRKQRHYIMEHCEILIENNAAQYLEKILYVKQEMRRNMLELQNIGYAVEEGNTRKEILKNISLKIDDRFVAITGPNGGGKSTLAKIIAGINKPTSGKILLDGEDITDLSVTERANKGIVLHFSSRSVLRD